MYKQTQATKKQLNEQSKKDMNKIKLKDVFHNIIENARGLENLTFGSPKPRDRKQINKLKLSL